MNTGSTQNESEARLLALLATLKQEVTPEAGFEDRFLYDFHERVARETVCCPAHKRFIEHLMQFLGNFGMRRWAYGASTLSVCALAVGYFTYPEDVPAPVARVQAKVSNHLECSLANLTPGLARDYNGCTYVSIEKAPLAYDKDNVLVLQDSDSGVSREINNHYTSSVYTEKSAMSDASFPSALLMFR